MPITQPTPRPCSVCHGDICWWAGWDFQLYQWKMIYPASHAIVHTYSRKPGYLSCVVQNKESTHRNLRNSFSTSTEKVCTCSTSYLSLYHSCAASADPGAISRCTKKIRAFPVPWLPWESQNSVTTACKSENHRNSMIRMINWHCQRDDRFLISLGNKCTYSMFSRLIWCVLQINFYC